LKQPDHIQEQVRQAAAGNPEAFTDLVAIGTPGLRLMLAAHVESFAAIALLELRIWVDASDRLRDYDGVQPFGQWLLALAAAPLTRHLQVVDRRALTTNDIIVHHLAQEALAALTVGSERNVLALTARLDALPDSVRALLIARYRDRQCLGAIAARLDVVEEALANELVTARASCDWRGVARPPTPSDRDLPPLIEELINGIIDNASRGRMVDYLGDPEHVQQVARQVRVHVALRALFLSFVRADAAVLARQAMAGGVQSGQVATRAAARSPVIARTMAISETQRVRASPPISRSAANSSNAVTSSSSSGSSSSSNTDSSASLARIPRARAVIDQMDKPRRRSVLPWIIGGVLVVAVGMIGLLVISRSGGVPAKPLAQIPPTLPMPKATPPLAGPPPVAAVTSSPTSSPVPPPEPAPAPVSTPLQVALVGVVADRHPYAGREVVLHAVLSSDAGIARVEYWNAEAKLGEATASPWSYAWTPSAGAMSLTARAVTEAGDLTSSPAIALTAVTAYGRGSLLREWWTGVPGEQLTEIAKVEGFPERPQGQAPVSEFAAPQDWGNDYVQRLRGFLIPPLDGDYVFWIAADDEAELWLSNDDTAQTRQRIATSPRITGAGIKPMEWERDARQRSAPIRLQAGRRYQIEALHKEGGGEDHIEVGWRLPDGTMERPIPGIHLSPPEAPAVPTAPATPSPAPAPAPAAMTMVPPPVVPTWTVVRAINLGGDTVEIDGVRWLGSRQAEAEGATPANTHQPGPWLSDLQWTRGTTGNGVIRRDRSMRGRPITLDGKVYAKGLGVHATSELVYALDGQWTGFTALAGVDDEVENGKGAMTFQVWLDGQKVWDSGVLREGSGAKPVAVPLAGRKELRLVVDSGGADDWDHADWANAQLLRAGGDDGVLQIKTGKRSSSSYTPKPAVDAKMRSLLTTALSGTSKEALEFTVRVPNGPLRVWLLVGEPGSANSRQFDLEVDGVALPQVNDLPASSWQKLGPVDLFVADEAVTVKATAIKGTPHLMGFLAERPELPVTVPLLSPSDPLGAIQDAGGYRQIYQADLAKLAKVVPYEVDNSRLFSGAFARIAYLLELQEANQPLRWVWTSMDAFTADVRLVGVPTLISGGVFQQTVANLLVASNVEGLPTGLVGMGVIEFWPNSYGGTNKSGIAGATDAFDFGDFADNQKPADGYGSMQVHNLSARQTVWALNHWVVGNKADLGIGPAANGGDWTFAANGDRYVLKRLRVFVKPAP